jgi:branched-chain amino acid transport system ATP-binding protein
MLEVKDLHSYYGAAHVLQGVTLSVPDGALIGLLGRNGMGKTTLIRSIMGMSPPVIQAGSILYDGQDLVGKSPHVVASQGIGLCPQGRRIFPSLSVVENLTIASRPPQESKNGGLNWNLEQVYDLFPRLGERKEHQGNQLSGGERQMLAIARALMTNPDLLLMDEPSEGLAPILVQQLGERLKMLKQLGLSIFLVEQNLGLALSVSDEIYILERGQVVFQGQPEELDANDELKHTYLGVGG